MCVDSRGKYGTHLDHDGGYGLVGVARRHNDLQEGHPLSSERLQGVVYLSGSIENSGGAGSQSIKNREQAAEENGKGKKTQREQEKDKGQKKGGYEEGGKARESSLLVKSGWSGETIAQDRQGRIGGGRNAGGGGRRQISY